jgi:hypothetical protein
VNYLGKNKMKDIQDKMTYVYFPLSWTCYRNESWHKVKQQFLKFYCWKQMADTQRKESIAMELCTCVLFWTPLFFGVWFMDLSYAVMRHKNSTPQGDLWSQGNSQD